jgi:hypothetical protein
MGGGRMKNKAPYFTKARFDSVCPETGKQIKKGDEIAYYPATRRAYHASSKAAGELRGLQFSQAFGLDDSNW